MKAARFTGSLVPVVTPFEHGGVDYASLKALIERLIEQGSHGIVACGTTGESSTLTVEEHESVIKFIVRTTEGRVPVIAGTGANSTAETIELTLSAAELGADGALLVTPYYNKPTQEGLFLHYQEVARACPGLPIILYNVPGRTGVNLEPDTVWRLTAFERIIGIKEASGNMRQLSDIIRLCGERIAVYSGDDYTTLPAYALGAVGTISVTANVLPKKVAAMWESWKKGDHEEATTIHYELEPLNAAMFLESNPIPVKSALAMMGFAREEYRLPLCRMSPANREKLAAVLRQYGLI